MSTEPTMKEIAEAIQKYRHDAVVPLASAARNSPWLAGTTLESALDNWCEKDKEILKIIDTCMAQVEAIGERRCWSCDYNTGSYLCSMGVDACSHDFGLLDKEDRDLLAGRAKEWLVCWQKAFGA